MQLPIEGLIKIAMGIVLGLVIMHPPTWPGGTREATRIDNWSNPSIWQQRSHIA